MCFHSHPTKRFQFLTARVCVRMYVYVCVRVYVRIIIINIISINRKQAVNLCAHLAKLLFGPPKTFDLRPPSYRLPPVPCPLSSIVAAPLLAPAGLARIIRIRRIRRTVSSIFDYRRTACAPFHSAANFRNESAQEYANNKEFAIDCSKAARRADTLYGDGRKTA